MENLCFGSKYLMIWSDFTNDDDNIIYYKSFISDEEDEVYRTYQIEEGNSERD